MENTDTYINILIDTLKKKEKVITDLTERTAKQAELLDEEEFDSEAFDGEIARKEELLAELAKLDEGFLDLYARVGDVLKNDTGEHAAQVKEAQELVRRQTGLSADLSAAEERNRVKLALKLSHGKQKIRDFKVGTRTAAAYYKNMSGKHQDGDSYFFNREK